MMRKIAVLLFTVFLAALLSACGLDLGSSLSDDEGVGYEITYSCADLYENSIGTVWISAIAEIENTGSVDLFLSSGSMDLEDEDGSLIKVLNLVSVYPQIISPGEKAYYYQSTILNDVSKEDDVSIVLHPDVAKSRRGKKLFAVTDVVINDREYFGIEAVGRVENSGTKDESLIYVAVVLFDISDKPLSVLLAMPTVNAGEKVGFEATVLSLNPSITKTSIAKFEAYAYSYQFQF